MQIEEGSKLRASPCEVADLAIEVTRALARFVDEQSRSADPLAISNAAATLSAVMGLLNGEPPVQVDAKRWVADILNDAQMTLRGETPSN